MRWMRRERLKYPRDGYFETILRIFLIWKLKRLKLMFETETGTGRTRLSQGLGMANRATLVHKNPISFTFTLGLYKVNLIYKLCRWKCRASRSPSFIH